MQEQDAKLATDRRKETNMSVELLQQNNNGVLELMMQRPAQKNALNISLYAALAEVFENIPPATRAVLLYGAEGNFTSGNDLSDFASLNLPFDEQHPLLRFMRGLALCPIPVVAAVEGVAVGIGTTMLLHCDLVYAHTDAVFRLPFVNLGLCPEYASSLLLPRLAGHVRAAELLLLGEKFSAVRALDCGLINAVTDNPLTMARTQCEKLCRQAPEAIRITKHLLKAPLQEPTLQVMQREGELFKQRLQSEEFKEAVTAFFEKRPADFSKTTSKNG
jgi:enoyl-CoA hydratase/carnithine racemase